MRRISTGTLLAAGLGCVMIAAQAPGVAYEGGAPQPLDGLSSEELERFEAGGQQFARVHGVADGLGPLFNGRSCAECHASPGPGGSDSGVSRQVVLFGRLEADGRFDVLRAEGGPVRQQRSIREELPGCRVTGEKLPPEANVKSHRQPAPLYGLGLIEAIPDDVILAQVKAGAAADPGEVYGRVNMVGGRVGRFGWKAQEATLERFIGQALAEELGRTNLLVTEEPTAQAGPIPEGCDVAADPEDDGWQLAALLDFVTLLAPAPRSFETGAAQRGAAVFQQVGCAACHTPSLPTGPSPIATLNEREAPLYSDLLIHDMGEYLADGTVQGQAGPTEWRTTPLWGLSRKTLYLHDGRTSDLKQVIDLHTGEARAARYRLRQRPKSDLEDLLAFLRTL
jgi:CxxC motif-containing protein (DUF1111 family)